MARGRSFSPVEEQLLRDNYDKTIAELEALFLENGYKRSRKSINRKLEKMREEGAIGFRSKSTIRRAYKQRVKKGKLPEPTKIPDNDGWDTGIDWNDL